MRVLILDNYDSFTYNLAQYIGELGADPVVYRNDVLTPADAMALAPERIVISPGPGRPEDAGYSMDYITALSPTIPTLGVCLGLQAAVAAFGGSVGLAPEPRHGKTSSITHDGKGIFAGIPNPFDATRYHSLAATDVPDVFEETAHSDDGVLQGIRHKSLPIEAVQFHPESIMTVHGKAILANFLALETTAPELVH
ncbi:MAG: aminodeoxychorismate/anthranilate synthase component II [Armatimonadetes bacterium]|nr:MAG: aminodeoxychorismate/anthranilate synthase component II [Armatimonadota bacterium]